MGPDIIELHVRTYIFISYVIYYFSLANVGSARSLSSLHNIARYL